MSARVGFVREERLARPQDLFALAMTENSRTRPGGGAGMKLGLGRELEGGPLEPSGKFLSPPRCTGRGVQSNIPVMHVMPPPVCVARRGIQRYGFPESRGGGLCCPKGTTFPAHARHAGVSSCEPLSFERLTLVAPFPRSEP